MPHSVVLPEAMGGEARVAGLGVEADHHWMAWERQGELQVGRYLAGEVVEEASVLIPVVQELLALEGWWWSTGDVGVG